MLLSGLALTLWVAGQAEPPTSRGPIAVALSSKRPGSEDYAKKIAQRIQELVAARLDTTVMSDEETSKAVGEKDPKTCQAVPNCLVAVAQTLGKRAVVLGVDVGRVRGTLAIYVEALTADTAESLAVADFTVSEKWEGALDKPITEFIKLLEPRLRLSRTSVVSPEPSSALLPKAEPKERIIVREVPAASASPRKIAGYVTLTSGGLLTALGLGSFVFAMVKRGDWDSKLARDCATCPALKDANGREISTLNDADKTALGNTINTSFILGILGAGLGVGLGAIGGWLLFGEPPPAAAESDRS